VVGRVILWRQLTSLSPWLRYGIARARVDVVKRLLRPGIASAGLSVGTMLNNQGVVIIIGVMLDPVSVVAFSTMRTLTRFAFQAINMINATVMPEMTMALGANDILLAQRLHRRSCQIAWWLSILAVSLLCIAGERIYGAWIHDRLHFDHWVFLLLLAVILVNTMWSTSSVVPVSINDIDRMSVFYILATLLTLVLAMPLTAAFGIRGAAASLVVVEMIMSIHVLKYSLGRLQDHLHDFLKAVLTVPSFRDLAANSGAGQGG
jgi:O-antigen/teichoic acid export membrane protein